MTLNHWVRRLDVASGAEGEWYSRSQALRRSFELQANLYLPFLVANADVSGKGLERVEMSVWDLQYVLARFKYQVKFLQQLRSKFSRLGSQDKSALQQFLERTGCWEPLASS